MLLPERRQWRRLFVLRTRKGHEVSWGYNNWVLLVNLSIYSRTKWDEQDKMVRFNDHKDFVDFDISRPNNKPSRFWTEVEILGKWSRTEKTLIIGANHIQKVARPDKSDHRESKNVQTRKEMQMWGERVKKSLRKTKGGNGEKKVFYEGRCEHGWGWGMVQEGGM